MPIDISVDDSTSNAGTTWLESFCCFDTMGFNTQQTREAQAEQTINCSMRDAERRNRWIEHRLKHRATNKQGLRKPLATAEQRVDLTMELNLFIRIVRFLIKDSGNHRAQDCYQVNEVGYRHRLGYIAATGNHPTMVGTTHPPASIA